ncbi:hypothetical protein [uncultured Aquimarina sp.]|uniref:toxin-antitoxin system YwqK family antitoxin n=1 Tax=uncultured Aquimarina sp. TaxID=575652 RepID=UPI00261DE253|nr:hypothetical protein [uncultured Aquimarina sp.]
MKKILFTLLSFLNLFFFTKTNAQELALLTNKITDSTYSNIGKQKNIQNTFYYNNGSIKEIRETKGNKLNGSWKLFYTNGKLKKEGAFKNDKTQGQWKIYNKNGALTFIENYNNGEEHGNWKAFYSDGKIKIEGTFVEGKRQGPWKIYNQLGALEKIVTFENDIEKSELILNHQPIDLNFFPVSQSIGNY